MREKGDTIAFKAILANIKKRMLAQTKSVEPSEVNDGGRSRIAPLRTSPAIQSARASFLARRTAA
jgi:hypothetical protein